METFLLNMLKNDLTIQSFNIKIIPNEPNIDQPLPYIAYYQSGEEDAVEATSLSRPTGVVFHLAQIDIWTLEAKLTNQVRAALIDLLHGYSDRANGVQGVFKLVDATLEEERGFHAIQNYKIILRT